MKTHGGALTTLLFIAIMSAMARGQTTHIWVGGDTGGPTDWSNPNNWSPASVPGSSDSAIIPTAANNPTLTVDVSCGPLVISTGIVSLSTFRITVNGTVNVGTSGTAATLNVNTGVLSSTGTITVGASGVIGTLNGNSGNILTGGNFSKAGSGVYNPSTSTLTLTGVSPTLSTAFDYFNLTVAISGTLLVNGSISVNGDLLITSGSLSIGGSGSITGTASKTLTVSSGGTLKTTKSTIGVSGFGAFELGGTVEYSSTTVRQIIDNTKTYANLSLTGAGGDKAAGGDLSINGDFLINPSATYNDSGFTTNVKGNWTLKGTFISTGLVNLRGISGQEVNSTSFNDLILDNSAGATLTGNITINGVLTLASGVLSVGSNKVTVISSFPDAVVITGGSVKGEIERAIASGSTGTYKFTDDHTRITPGGSQGAITVSVKSFPNTDAPNDPTSEAIRRYYSITPSGALTGTLRLAYAESEVRVGQDESQFSLWRYAPPWTDMLSSNLSATENWVEQTNISTWSNWTISPSGSGLPIQLASLHASVLRNNDVEVVWRTISETNNYGFDIERRRTYNGSSDANPQWGAKGSPWRKIAFVEGHGTTLAPQSYSYVDRSVPFGRYSYRIRQIDLNGKVEIFPGMEVNVGIEPGKFILAQNYPNPFNPSTIIEFAVAQAGWVTVRVYNLLGQEVATLHDGPVEANKINSARFDAVGLRTGLYFYQLRNGSNVETKRMMLTK
jgi:hypothetical protein